MNDFKPGLEGIVAVETEIMEPDRDGGTLRYRGVDVEPLVGRRLAVAVKQPAHPVHEDFGAAARNARGPPQSADR